MIKAVFTSYDEIRYLRLSVRGHAGQAEKGQDIVCASASILLYTVAQIVKAMEKHGDLAVPPIVDIEDGNALICLQCNTDELYAEASHTFFVARTGFSLLAENYPQYVELITVGKTEES